MKYVGQSLRTLGEFDAPYGVDVLLELHDQFRYWGYARGAVEIANHPNVALVYNCEQADIVGGSVASTYDRVRKWVRRFARGVCRLPWKHCFANTSQMLRGSTQTHDLAVDLPLTDDAKRIIMGMDAPRRFAKIKVPV